MWWHKASAHGKSDDGIIKVIESHNKDYVKV